jgi:hypothetical protein
MLEAEIENCLQADRTIQMAVQVNGKVGSIILSIRRTMLDSFQYYNSGRSKLAN